MASVALKSVCKTYPGGVRAVDGVSLEIPSEKFAVLVGPSGCGKSTTLRMVAGLEEVTSGSIEIGGRMVTELPPKDRDIAMVFQNYALYPHMTVRKNMAFGLTLRRRELGLSKDDIDRRVRDTAATLGIGELLDRKPRQLSGGQRQRVAVGRAIVRNPKAFLFDEPLSNVDAKLRMEMRAEIKKLQRRLRTTTIYVTHDQEEAMTLGDLIVVMKDGRIQQAGPPLEVYRRPANRFVGEFIGTPPMNFFAGRIVSDGGRTVFDEGSARWPLPQRLAEAAGPFADHGLVLGIRPEAISAEPRRDRGLHCPACQAEASGSYCQSCGARLGTAGSSESVSLEARVAVVEPLGDQQDVHLSTRSTERFIGRMDARTIVSDGQSLRVFLDLSAAHLFEAGPMGRNVSLGREHTALSS